MLHGVFEICYFFCVVVCLIICIIVIYGLICFIIKYFKQLFYAFVIICWIIIGLCFCSRFLDGCNGNNSDSTSLQNIDTVDSSDFVNRSSSQCGTSNYATDTINYNSTQSAPITTSRKCPDCDGRGFLIVTYSQYDIWAPNYPEKIKCETCNGTGQIQ